MNAFTFKKPLNAGAF